jgi:hypothetical protein
MILVRVSTSGYALALRHTEGYAHHVQTRAMTYIRAENIMRACVERDSIDPIFDSNVSRTWGD